MRRVLTLGLCLPALCVAGSIICALSCGEATLPDQTSLLDRQPFVIQSEPPDKALLTNASDIQIVFSHPVDPETVHAKTFLIVSTDPSPFTLGALREKITKSEIKSVEGTYQTSDNIQFSWTPTTPLAAGSYWLLILPDIFTPDQIPFNQQPGQSPTPFITQFSVASEPTAPAADTSPTEESGPKNPNHLKLSEVFYDAKESDTDGYLFIELYGEPNALIEGYKIVLINGENGAITEIIQLPPTTTIPSDGFFVLADATSGTKQATRVAEADWVDNFDPQNGPDCVQLLSPKGELVDVLGYGTPLVEKAANGLACYLGTPAPDVPSGHSLETDQNTWHDNPQPTPGYNTAFAP